MPTKHLRYLDKEEKTAVLYDHFVDGASIKNIARLYGVGISSVSRWVKEFRDTGMVRGKSYTITHADVYRHEEDVYAKEEHTHPNGLAGMFKDFLDTHNMMQMAVDDLKKDETWNKVRVAYDGKFYEFVRHPFTWMERDEIEIIRIS